MTILADKLTFALKAISISRSRLSAIMGVDKSAVARWLTGAVRPSAENLARLTTIVAERAPGFSVLDWDRDLEGLAAILGITAPAEIVACAPRFGAGLPLDFLEQSLATTNVRGGAYEGFFRSTRPYSQRPGQFIHDQIMIRRHKNGLLRMSQRTAGVSAEGWLLLQQNQLFFIGAELTTGGPAFAILNGVNTVQAGVLEGIVLTCALDPGRTPTAVAAIFERIGDLTGNREADDARLEEMASGEILAAEDAVSDELRRHLTRDIGPSQLAVGGDWLLSLPIARSMSRGLFP